MLEKVKFLHDAGWDIIPLKSQNKMPIENGWTTRKRKTWAELQAIYKPGMNLGVRTGSRSKIGEKYLVAIDCDVKSTDPKHLEEMETALSKLYPNTVWGRICYSGRGNGSRHLYGLSENPVQGCKLARSSELVKCRMSGPASVRDKTELPGEWQKGWRMRNAWEIEIMGNGKQLVIPPSQHPDPSCGVYVWGGDETLPDIELPQGFVAAADHKNRTRLEPTQHFDFVEVDLSKSPITDAVRGLIVNYTGGTNDRSADAYKAAHALSRAGHTPIEIVSVLSDPANRISECGYDRRGEDRQSVAAWFWEHTILKVIRENDAGAKFDAAVEELPELDEAGMQAQAETLKENLCWTGKINVNKHGVPNASFHNVRLILENAVEQPLVKVNLFANRDHYGVDTPWGGLCGEELTDGDEIKIKSWIEETFHFEPDVRLIREVLVLLTLQNSYHPVRDYLNGLTWDGVSRIDSWLKDYMGAVEKEKESEYLSAVSRKFLCAAVARVFEPGVKFDHVLILEGKQGVGKSSVGKILASPAWFTDHLPVLDDKDSRLSLPGNWIIELSELASLKDDKKEQHKAFLTATEDRVRPHYGKRTVNLKRECVFLGTTNECSYLTDHTGNRRYWPVEVTQCDFKKLERDRDQLWAEAVFVWQELGEPLFLNKAEGAQLDALSEDRLVPDMRGTMEELFLNFLEDNAKHDDANKIDLNKFKLLSLFGGMGPFNSTYGFKGVGRDVKIACNILRAHGFERRKIRGFYFWGPSHTMRIAKTEISVPPKTQQKLQ